MARHNHLHRYEKKILGKKGYTVFACNLPDCPHYISDKLVKGKRAICNRCGGEMIMDSRAMKFVKPYCPNCGQTKHKSETHDKLLEFVEAHDKGLLDIDKP